MKNGLFLKIDTYPNPKTNFVRNEIYSKILPKDRIQYKIQEDGKVEVLSILERTPFETVGIVKDESPFNYYLHTPLLTPNFVGYIKKVPQFPLMVGERLIIQVHKNKIFIVARYGDIQDRRMDHHILGDLYLESYKPRQRHSILNLEYMASLPNCYTKPYQDLTHLQTITVDPIQTKDYDDAISVDVENQKVYIHIVDINQAEPGSWMDRRMAFLGQTFYTPQGNYNILPPDYSENHYSLKEGHKREVITFQLNIDTNHNDNSELSTNHNKNELSTNENDNNNELSTNDNDNNNELSTNDNENNPLRLPIIGYEIYPSQIRVKNRFHYKNILGMEEVRDDIRYLKELSERYYRRRMNLVQPTYQIDQESGKLEGIEYEDMDSWSHQMIEMLMITANELITNHMRNNNVKVPERYHPASMGEVEPCTGDKQIDSVIMIQKYKTARYDNQNTSHFGLQLENYTHFTSPIRRYNDVIVARMLAGHQYSPQSLETVLNHLNQREEMNGEYTKLYQKWKMIDYLSTNPFNIYQAHVTGIPPAGVKFYIKDLGYDGFFLNHVLRRPKESYQIGSLIPIQAVETSLTSFQEIRWREVLPNE